jgi:hypothetical protein
MSKDIKILQMIRSPDSEMVELGIRTLFTLDTHSRLSFVYTYFSDRGSYFNTIKIDENVRIRKKFKKDKYCMYVYGGRIFFHSISVKTDPIRDYQIIKL